jgi:hypothetical protein
MGALAKTEHPDAADAGLRRAGIVKVKLYWMVLAPMAKCL